MKEMMQRLEMIQKDNMLESGYPFIRCINCIAPALTAVIQGYSGKEIKGKLQEVIEAINLSYLEAADHRLSESADQQFRCGYDCIFYEDKREACPFSFWEYNPEKIDILLGILEFNNN